MAYIIILRHMIIYNIDLSLREMFLESVTIVYSSNFKYFVSNVIKQSNTKSPFTYYCFVKASINFYPNT
jgi:hypothetical protein